MKEGASVFSALIYRPYLETETRNYPSGKHFLYFCSFFVPFVYFCKIFLACSAIACMRCLIHGASIMPIRVVRLGTPRAANEGLRIGTVRRPPRGVPKTKFASQNWYDVWFPNVAPSAPTMKLGLSAETPAQWTAFTKKYRAEMSAPENAHAIELLAKLRALLKEKGASLVT